MFNKIFDVEKVKITTRELVSILRGDAPAEEQLKALIEIVQVGTFIDLVDLTQESEEKRIQMKQLKIPQTETVVVVNSQIELGVREDVFMANFQRGLELMVMGARGSLNAEEVQKAEHFIGNLDKEKLRPDGYVAPTAEQLQPPVSPNQPVTPVGTTPPVVASQPPVAIVVPATIPPVVVMQPTAQVPSTETIVPAQAVEVQPQQAESVPEIVKEPAASTLTPIETPAQPTEVATPPIQTNPEEVLQPKALPAQQPGNPTTSPFGASIIAPIKINNEVTKPDSQEPVAQPNSALVPPIANATPSQNQTTESLPPLPN